MTPRAAPPAYAELCVTTNFTFLTGASHPEELILRAAELGLEAIAFTDRNSLAGVVRGWCALNNLAQEAEALRIRSSHQIDACSRQEVGRPRDLTPPAALRLPRLIVGARIVLRDCAVEWLALPMDRAAYHRLSRLLSEGKGRATKGDCHLDLADLVENGAGMILIALPATEARSGGRHGANPTKGLVGPTADRPPAPPQTAAATGPSQRAGDLVAEDAPDDLTAPSVQGAKGAPDAPTGPSMQGVGSGSAMTPPATEAGPDAMPDPATKEGRDPCTPLAAPCTPPPQLPPYRDPRAPLAALAARYPGQVYLGAAPRYDGTDQAWFDRCAGWAAAAGVPLVAVGDVLMHHAARRPLADVLTCLREGRTIDTIGTRALPNAERRLKGAADMARLFRRHPDAIARTAEIAARCRFDLSQLRYDYPDEVAHGEPPQDRLTRLTQAGLAARCPNGISERYRGLLAKELSIVGDLGYAAYFLTVHDIVSFARSQGILCQGRGSAANSIICWALGITDVSPDMIGMVFERFVSRHRGEPPDIDVDFEHERREEVIQWIYEKYGRHRAGLCATVIHFRSRAAIREVGKVMGLSQDVTARLAGQIWGMSGRGAEPERVRELGLDPTEPRLALTLRLIGEIIGFPRHLSQHVGGFVITQGRLDELCPIGPAAMAGRTCLEWDKDDIDALHILKVDVLGLGMLTGLRKAFRLLEEQEGLSHTLASVPQEDPATYAMLQRADAIGVFQVESRAQMNFLPRMKPKTFYDLVIEVAIVRPGPIQGGMVKPYIRRRLGLEAPEPFGPALAAVTQKTLGVPLFQEQAMQIAIVGAGYSAEEADQLRRSLASFRRMGTIEQHKGRFIEGMRANGYAPEVAARCFSQIEGFADYGFPESHAAAFAMLTYVSAWLKCHHPAVFACALLNAQPMGFYAPAQIVRDLRDHGVEVRPVCVNQSLWDNRLERRGEGALALRLGFRQIKGFREADAVAIAGARANGYPDPESLWLRARVAPAVLERLAEADAFTGLGLTRREALWAVRAIRAPAPLPLFADPVDGEGIREPAALLPRMTEGEEVVEDYVATRLSLRAHPMALLRPALPGLTPHGDLVRTHQRWLAVCGLVITRQRPGTASGVIFLTLEDETGSANVVVWPQVYARFRAAVMGGRLLRITGRLQREGIVTHLIAERIEDLSHRLADLGHPLGDAVGQTEPQADNAPRPHHPRDQIRWLFPSRDFH